MGEEELGVSQSPGGFFFFWNVIVPLTIIINIRKFGFRKHEMGLIVALSLNSYVLEFLMRSLVVSTIVVWFLILWLERILSRWIWYRIYTLGFAQHTLIYLAAVAVPALILQVFWNPLSCMLRALMQKWVQKDVADTVVDAMFMLAASFLLVRVILAKRDEGFGFFNSCATKRPTCKKRCGS